MCTNGDVLVAEACRSSYADNNRTMEHHVYVGRERSTSLQLPTQTPSMKYISTSPTGGFRSLHEPEGRSYTPCARYQRRSGYQQPKPSSAPGLLDEPSPFLNLSLSRVHAVKSDEGLTSTVEGRTNRLHVSRDNEQPLTGSLSKLHRRLSEGSFLGGGSTTTRTKSVDVDEEGEEMDSLGSLEPSRPRSSTCPDTKAFRRHLKAKMLMRPPSPPLPDSSNILRRLSSEAISRSSGSLNGGCLLAEELFLEDDEFAVDSCSTSVAPDLPVIVES